MVFKNTKKFFTKPTIKIIFILILLLFAVVLFYWYSRTSTSKPCNCGLHGSCNCRMRTKKKKVHWNLEENFAGSGNWTDHVDVIYYINLDRREDRNKQFLDEMKRMDVPNSKIVRIPAVDKSKQKKGDWGCSLSHVNAIQEMVNSGYKNCIIFEDDFEFKVDNVETLNKMFQSIVDQKVDYDVIMFSSNEVDVRPSQYQYLNRVYDAQTASGYMVSAKFAPTLLKNFQEGSEKIGESYNKGKGDNIQGPFCVDQYWKKLQPKANWYVFTPKIGKQRSSVSDIQGGFVEMDV